MKKFKREWKRMAAIALAVLMVSNTIDISVFAVSASEETQVASCEHHTEHTEDCGYSEGAVGSPCIHEHGEECYTKTVECIHNHDESCGYSEAQEGSFCTHECSEEGGCVIVTENCIHTEHDETCGYAKVVAGSPCTYICEECVQEGEEKKEGDTVTCTCAEKCTEENIHVDCAVCSVDGADLSSCEGTVTVDELFAYFSSPQMASTSAETSLVNGTCGDTATYVIYDTDSDNLGDKLVISGSGATVSTSWEYKGYFNERDEKAKVHAATIKTVIIEEGITTIGDRLLSGMSAIETISIPNSLTSIGLGGISGCSALTDLQFSDSPTLSSLGASAFEDCTAYNPIILPPSVTSVNSSVCGNDIKIIYMPTALAKTFSSTAGLVLGYELDEDTKEAHITYLNGNRTDFLGGISIEPELFGYPVTSVTNKMVDITILCNEHYMKDYTCQICGYTTKCGDNCRWEYSDGVLSIIGSGNMWDYGYVSSNEPEWLTKYRNEIKEVCFDEGITKIGMCVLYNAENLEKVTFKGNEIAAIGQMAFAGCTNLKDVELEKLSSLENIHASAFASCTALENITLNENTIYLYNGVFYRSDKVTVACSEDIKSVDEFANQDLLLYKVENGQKVVTVPFAEMCEIPDIEYYNGSILVKPQDVIQIKEEFAESYQFDGYEYGVDVHFSDFYYEIAEEVTGTGSYTLNLSYQFSNNGGEDHTKTIIVPFNVIDHVHSTGKEGDRSANCKEKAYCSVCQSEYGELGNHDAAFSAADNMITGTCSICNAEVGVFTLVAPNESELVYDGAGKEATVNGTIDGVATPMIVYDTADGGAPVNAGNYTASITLGEGENAVTASVNFEIEKATLNVARTEAEGREYDGTNIVTITAIHLNGILNNDEVSVQTTGLTGTLNSANAGTYTSVTLPNLSLTGTAAGNYTLEQPSGAVPTTVEISIAENVLNMPGITMNVSNKYTKIGDVPLPTGWEWQNTDKETSLEVDIPVTATAVYTGADKDNYINVTVQITVTRNACDHVAGSILYTGEGEKAPTCTEGGLGHTECTECGTVMESGIVVKALGHTGGTATCSSKAVCARCKQPYGSTDGSKHGSTEVRGYVAATCTSGGYTGDTYCKDCGSSLSSGTSTGAAGHDYAGVVTKEPTTEETGTRTYTCSDCGHTYTEPIEKTESGVADGEDGTGTDTEAPFIKDDEGKEGWDVIRGELDDTRDGDTVTVDMNGSTVVPGDVFNDIKGKDVTVVFDMGNGITWSVNGKDITSDNVGDIDFSVKVGADANNTIPVEIINKVTGERYYMNISLAYDGEFGFKAVMTLNVDAKNAGLIANLFYFNEQTGEMEFICADEIAEDGTAELTFTHASEYTVVIDKEAMGAATSPDISDVSSPLVFGSDDDGSAWWIILLIAILAVAGVVVFVIYSKKKKEEE